jgi:hypothetical protein
MTATVTGIHLGIDTHANRPAANAAPAGSIYSCSTHGLIYKTDGSSWSTYATLGGGATNLDGLSDYAVATSFPGSPSTNDQCFRTDRDLLYFYNGTRWLTVQLYKESLGSQDQLNPFATNATMARMSTWFNDYDLWIETFYCFTYVVTTNSGVSYWTVDLKRGLAANVIATFNTSADAANLHKGHKAAAGALLTTTEVEMEVVITKTGTPGSIYVAGAVTYRLVG